MEMKLLLLSLLILAGCTREYCHKTYRNYSYLNKVKIHDTFYDGQTGVILQQSQIYISGACNTLSFDVKLDSTGVTIREPQDNLELLK